MAPLTLAVGLAGFLYPKVFSSFALSWARPYYSNVEVSLMLNTKLHSKSRIDIIAIENQTDGIKYPWDLTQVPNYSSSKTVPVEEAGNLDERTFEHRYVRRNCPCLIKDAAKKWPAFRKWRDAGYVLSKIGDVEARASCWPKLEAFGLRSESQDRIVGNTTREHLLPAEKVEQLLPRIRKADDEVLFIELRPADKLVRGLGADLLVDGSRFSFLRRPSRPKFFSSSARRDW